MNDFKPGSSAINNQDRGQSIKQSQDERKKEKHDKYKQKKKADKAERTTDYRQQKAAREQDSEQCNHCGKFHPGTCSFSYNHPDANKSDTAWADSDAGKRWKAVWAATRSTAASA